MRPAKAELVSTHAVEAFIRSSEPGTASRDDPDDPVTPLPPGTLTDNLALPVVIVCTKARVMIVHA